MLHDKIATEHKNMALLRRDPLTGLSNHSELRSSLQNLSTSAAQNRTQSDAQRKAEQIISELSRPITLDQGQSARVGVSIGIAQCPGHSQNPEELIKLADQALYQAKAAGKGTFKHSCR